MAVVTELGPASTSTVAVNHKIHGGSERHVGTRAPETKQTTQIDPLGGEWPSVGQKGSTRKDGRPELVGATRSDRIQGNAIERPHGSICILTNSPGVRGVKPLLADGEELGLGFSSAPTSAKPPNPTLRSDISVTFGKRVRTSECDPLHKQSRCA